MKRSAFLRNKSGVQLVCKNLSSRAYQSPVVLSFGIFRWLPITPCFLRFFHPLHGSIRKQRPHAPARATIWVRGAVEHRTCDLLGQRPRVAVSCRVWQVISACFASRPYETGKKSVHCPPGRDMDCTIAVRIPLSVRAGWVDFTKASNPC